jgi:hypothetical protein
VIASAIRSDFAVNLNKYKDESSKSSKLRNIKKRWFEYVNTKPEISIKPNALIAENLIKAGFVNKKIKNIDKGSIHASIILFCHINNVTSGDIRSI